MDKVLILIDTLKDFYEPKGALFGGPTFPASVEFLVARAREYAVNNKPVFLLGDSHEEDDKEFERFPKHCVMGTWGAEPINELEGFPLTRIVKKRYSGFFETGLDSALWAKGIHPDTHSIEVAGCCTHICVMDTVGDFANRDFKTVLYSKAVVDFDQEMHKMALKRMASLYGTEVF